MQANAQKWILKTIVLLTFPLLASSLSAQSATPLPQLDQTRFTGTWYEIARLPYRREKKCVSDAVQLIALGDKTNQFEFVNSCTGPKAFDDVWNSSGRSKTANGALKVPSFLWPLSRSYWVLAVGPEYEWSLVGSPNHKNLWILSKTRTMNPDVLTEIKAKAAAQGFAAAKLTMTPQTPQ